MMPAHTGEGHLLYSVRQPKRSYLLEASSQTPPEAFNQLAVWASHDPVKLAYKVSHLAGILSPEKGITHELSASGSALGCGNGAG